jgi:predicted alpha/beta-hydrolase family hydrolase
VPGAVERFEVDSELPAVRGFLHRPTTPGGDGLVLTHGAGGNCSSPLLVDLAAAFASAGLTVLRCDLPYRQARAHGPPSPAGAERDREGLARAVQAVRALASRRVFLGGMSYGGRQASMLAADAQLIDGLLLLSYPLHPPAKPSVSRTGHFDRLRSPALFVHGTQDPFGSLDELEAARTRIPAKTALLPVAGGHDLGYARAKASDPLAARIVTAFRALMS